VRRPNRLLVGVESQQNDRQDSTTYRRRLENRRAMADNERRDSAS
jgi:hypothetical protein